MSRLTIPEPMRLALSLAKLAAESDEVPVGAVITKGSEVLSAAHNAPRDMNDPTCHAEIMAIRVAAAKLESERLTGCDIWVTLEPCAMCAGAISHARLKRLYFAAPDPKGGAVLHGPRLYNQAQCLHQPEIYSGLAEKESADMLRAFFAERRG